MLEYTHTHTHTYRYDHNHKYADIKSLFNHKFYCEYSQNLRRSINPIWLILPV